MTTKSAKHANKTFGSAKDESAKAVDMRKVAALSAGAASVIAGAAIAFGATPAMAAETPASAPVNTNDPAKEQSVIANKNKTEGEDSKKTATETNKKEESKKEQPEQTKPTEQTVVKTEGKADATKTESGSKVESATAVDNKVTNSTSATDKTNADSSTTEETSTPAENVVKKRTRRAAVENKQPEATNYAKDENQKQGEPVVGADREANPAPAPQVNSEITLSKETKDTLPNMYAWGSSDNTYIEKGQNQSVTFKFAAPTDGSTITKVAIFPSDGNTVDNAKSRKFLEYYSDAAAVNEHQPYSGTYEFKVDNDGTATLTMTKLYRNGNLKSGESYSANRCIYVYGTDKNGKTVVLYKTNIVRAATLIPPKTAGSIVLKYNEALTEKQIQDKLKAALDAPTEATGKKSIRAQIDAASRSNGVGGRTGVNGAFVQTPDDPEKKVVITDKQAYDPSQVTRINTVTSKKDQPTTYVAGAQTLKTYLVSDLGYKSEALALTVARYDTRIDKPIVDDLSKVSDDVKTEIKRKLAHLNHVSQDQVTINDQGEVTINFAGVDENDAPKIALSDLVLKKIAEKDVVVPAGEKAVFVANPLGYSNAELDRIKTAIYEANKDNEELGLTSKDQISLSYLTGDLTGAGDANKGRSNGLQENNISVTIKTDKALAEFTSDITKDKLTRLPDIRKDYNVELVKNKLDGRDSDEGFSWSDDKHTTLIYRYDPTKAQAFTAPEILKLIKATPKDQKTGLRPLAGGEALDHEGANGKARKSHVYYSIDKNGEPTTELTLGMMSGPYWIGNPQVANSDVNMGDEESKVGQYTWDTEAGSVTVAAKQNKVFKTRLFVAPYTLTYYRGVYTNPYQKDPNNTPKAINIIFVPQTNHKTKDLKDSIGEHATTQVEGKDIPTDSKYYNASDKVKKDYEDALKVAKQTLEKVGTTTDDKLSEQLKAEVDNATINLNKARAELDGADTKKDELDKSITEDGTPAEGQQATTGTKASDKYKNVSDPDFKTPEGKTDEARNNAAKEAKKAYDEALAEAEKVKADDNATQKAVDDAKAKLDAARAKLNDFTTSKDKLNAAIAEHGQVNTGDAKLTDPDKKLASADPTYQNSTPEQRKAYDDAVKKANELAKDPNASQKDVNAAIDALQKAKAALDAKATDKSKLIAAEKLSFDNPDKTDASKQSTFYKNALNKQTNGANEQEKQAAKTAVENYDNALDNARKVLKNDKATQAEVDDAKKKLEAAEKALHDGYATDPDELTKVLADNFSGYLMPAYFNAFDKAQAGDADAKKAFKDYNDAYQKAKELKENLEKAKTGGKAPTQTEIDEAKTALETARTVIDKYATNTSRLSAAVFNDIAIQKSPAYKNVSADDASEEAKEAKKKYDAAVEKLHKALANKLPKDPVPDSNTPKKDGNLNDKDYLKDIQAHKNGEPLDRDVDAILKEMNAAAAELNKFATKTDALLKSVNEHDNTQQTPAFKNANHPAFKQADGKTADDTKNTAAKAAVDAYGDALNKAKELLKNPAATQKEVNDALKKLDDARTALDAYKTDVKALKASVDKHGSTEGPAATEGTQTSDAYRNASDPHFIKEDGGKLVPDKEKNTQAAAAKKAYDEALTKAQELLKKHGDKDTPQDAKPTQTEINAALDALDTARTNLDTYKTDTSKLEEETRKSTAEGAPAVTENDFENTPEFKNAQAKTSNGQTNADVAAYQEALKKARDLAKAAADQDKKNSERPTQKQINEALDALKAAKKQITDNYKTNLEALTAAKDFADGDFKNTPEYKNALAKKTAGDQGATNDLGKDGEQTGFDNILKKVADKLNDDTWKQKATQKEVSALLKQLQDAQEKIAKTYKTDAIKLEREVGDKDQDGKPVVPPFEASVTYKNALEKAKTEDAATTDPNSATKKLEAYNEKLKAAQELINKVNNPDPNAKPEDRPTQVQVDKALQDLKDAKDAITNGFKTDVTALQNEAEDNDEHGNAKQEADKFENSTEFKNLKAKQEGNTKPDDLVAYEQALAKAKELVDKNDGMVADPNDSTKQIAVPKDQLPTQKEVDEAQKALKEIKDKILANYKTNSTELKMEVDKSKDGKDDTRTDVFENTPAFKNADAKKGDDGKDNADMAAYKTALADAKALLDKFDPATGLPKTNLPSGEKAPTKKQLDDALQKLQDAKSKIEKDYATKKEELKSEADANDAFTKTPEYQNAQTKGDDASKQALEDYKKALEDANKVLGDKDATQAQVDEALKKLQDAKKKLSDGYKTDKTDLRQEAGKDSDFTQSPEYQNAAGSSEAEAYKRALDEANAVLKNPNATQAQVDEALRRLKDAKQKLTDSHKTDKSDLNTEADNDPDFRKSIPFIIGKAADLAEYQQALNDADSVLKDPNATQDQVNRALRRLRDAKQKLIDAYNRLINSGSGVGDNTGVGVNDSNTTSVNNVVDKGALQAEVDQVLGDVSANASGVVADSNLVSEFNAALNYARLVLADANATQGQVDSALARLRAARAALRAGMLAARNSAGMNIKRGDVSGVNTGASSSVFAALAAVFAGLGVAGAASKRRKHSAR